MLDSIRELFGRREMSKKIVSTQQISLRHVAHKLLLDNFQIPELREREREREMFFIHNKFRYLLIAF
jgi:hypothetical protein